MEENIKKGFRFIIDETVKFKLEIIAIVCILGAIITVATVVGNVDKRMAELKSEMDIIYSEFDAVYKEYVTLEENYDLLGNELEAQIAINHVWATNNTDIKQLIYTAALAYDVDPIMCIAIARLESGNFMSDLFIANYNLGGIKKANGDYVKYNTIHEGVNNFVHLIANYKARGMDTPEKMQSTYCPPNKKWDEQVRALMKEEDVNDYY